MKRNTLIIQFFLLLFLSSCGEKEEKKTLQDYENAISFLYANYNNKTAFNLFTQVNWFENNSGFWFIEYHKDGKEFKTVSFDDFKVKQLFEYDTLVKAITEFNESFTEINGVSFSDFEPIQNGLSFSYANEKYKVNLISYALEKVDKEVVQKGNPFESLSPDKKWIAFEKDFNLYIKSTKTNKVHQLTYDGQKEYEYASRYGWFDKMKGENGERPRNFFVNWSKDSKWISTNLVDTRNAEKMYLLDWSKDDVYKPELLSYYRGSPGDSNMVMLKPVFFNINTKKQVQSNLPKHTHINPVSSQFTDKSGVVIAQIPYRGFQKTEILEVDLNKQTTKNLVTETSKTNIDNFEYRFLEKGQKIIFLSDRSGWRQLYLLDLKTNITKLLTSDSYFINDIQYLDEENETIYFLASGKEAENNPYHQQLYKVNFKGKEQLLTPEMKHHQINFSKDGKYFVDNISTINSPTKTVLREAVSGNILAELTNADISDAESRGYETPETFSMIAKDGKTTIYGALWKPTNFDASKKYPIIDATYTGPHTQVFPKSFDGAFSMQSLAELDFIVMRVDGLGTAGRSKSFLNYSYKNMGNNLEDHVLAMKHLANKYSWIDIDKVGIYGHSAGGYDTGRAMLAFPDFYKVGVASSADHDFRMEKAWWPEMYQGWPVDSTYQNVSNITNAAKLKGKLLLVHGGLDDNVNPSATFKLAEALVNADKEFDLLIFPSQRHGYQGKARDYFLKKRWNYFIEHLQGIEPIWNFNLE